MLRESIPFSFVMLLTFKSVLEKKLKYRISHPISDANSWQEKISPGRILHNLGWMSAMVSTAEAKQVFGRAFSRPPRLLFTNPVCFLFSAYYSYIYGMSLSSLIEAD
jgi:DHA1 family multidrug resistance protein-like MFS transporter